ncbi:MAG: tetratricopeptide repeat protein, partial [Chloroflexi bacterium]
TGAFTESLRDLNRLIELGDTGRTLSAYSNRGFVYFMLQRYDEALADHTAAIMHQPHVELNYDDRINVYEAMGKVELALLDSYIRDGLRSLDDGQTEEAIQSFTQVISDPSAAGLIDPMMYAYYNLGRAYAASDDPAQALEAFQSAIDLSPDYAPTYYQVGKTYLGQGDYELALSSYARALELDPLLAVAYFGRAMAYEGLGRHPDAVRSYWEGITLLDAHQVEWIPPLPGQFTTFALAPGWVYTIPFEGRAGEPVKIETEVVDTVPSEVDPVIVLLGVDGQPIDADNNSGTDDRGDMLAINLPADGWYTLVVSHALTSTGMVRLRLTTSADELVSSPDLPASSGTPAQTTCEIQANNQVNLRSGPGTDFAIAGILSAGQAGTIDAQAAGSDGLVWWHLVSDQWVRSDVVVARGDCFAVPIITP